MSNSFVLFVGNTLPDAAVSRLKASGVYYMQKKLESNAANWQEIRELVDDKSLKGVVAKLTGANFPVMLRPSHADVAAQLMASLGGVPHVMFVHETILTGKEITPSDDGEDEGDFYYYSFDEVPDEIRREVLSFLEANEINVVPYRTNAELSVLAASFIEDHEKNLLFRIYVPAGRIYAAEADKLLSMFREWLIQVKRQRVRQDGYTTGSGHVYELFGDDELTSSALSAQFSDFSRFLDLCVDDPAEASRALTQMGVDTPTADDVVRRYSKETKRLHLDLRHARESRLVSIKHRLESELVDGLDSNDPQWREIDRAVQQLVPAQTGLTSALNPAAGLLPAGSNPAQIVINQQYVGVVQGTVTQGVQGTVNLGCEAQELLELIQRFGGDEGAALESAMHELEDEDARAPDRLVARQRIKGFLFKLGDKAEEATLNVLQRYIETKLGV